MKAIATVNFKGGVGKTTMTWLLAKYASEICNKKVLVVDTDAQMSLTLAAQLQEDGALQRDFEDWYENQHKRHKKTLLDALEEYDRSQGGHFDFSITNSFIYTMSQRLHFIPSVVDLYWLELDVFDREKVKHFIRALMGKIEHSKAHKYDYILFDCPPNFTALSYSVLSCSSLILIPVNPDVFASRGIRLMLDGLQMRVQPWPDPKVAVFMNKAKFRVGRLTRETQQYWRESTIVANAARQQGIDIEAWDSAIPERVDIKRAIPRATFPREFEPDFAGVWKNVERILS